MSERAICGARNEDGRACTAVPFHTGWHAVLTGGGGPPLAIWPTDAQRIADLEKALVEVKLRCDCRWSDTSAKLDEIDDMLVPAALPEGAVVLSRMPTAEEFGAAYRSGVTHVLGGDRIRDLLDSLEVLS